MKARLAAFFVAVTALMLGAAACGELQGLNRQAVEDQQGLEEQGQRIEELEQQVEDQQQPIAELEQQNGLGGGILENQQDFGGGVFEDRDQQQAFEEQQVEDQEQQITEYEEVWRDRPR